MYVKKPIHHVFLTAGIIAAAVEGLSNIDHIRKHVDSLFDPAVLAAAITSVGAAILLAGVIKAFNQKHVFIGLGLALTLIVTCFYTGSTTLARTTENRQTSLQKVFEADGQWQAQFKLYKSLAERTAWECGQGAGDKCQKNRIAANLAQAELKTRQNELDAMGKQVKWMLSPIVALDVETAGNIQPLFLPLALMLLAMMAVAFGEKGEWVAPEFDVALSGREAIEDKARRYIEAYKKSNAGSMPPVSAIQKVVDIKEWQARTLHKKYANA